MEKKLPVIIAVQRGKPSRVNSLQKQFTDSGFVFRALQSTGNDRADIVNLIGALGNDKGSALLLWDPERVSVSEDFALLEDAPQGILFPASSHLDFDDEGLFYFYWKHYPRTHKKYHFLDTTMFMGSCQELASLFEDALEKYQDVQSVKVLLTRYYVDGISGCFTPRASVRLDHSQKLFAVTQLSSKAKMELGWMYELLFQNHESRLLRANSLEKGLRFPLNVKESENRFFQEGTKTRPLFLICDPVPEDAVNVPKSIIRKIHGDAIKEFYQINKKNKWTHAPAKLFRFQVNKAPAITEATEQIVQRLEAGKPLSFAHYNDGELTFIRDYLKNDHHEKWFGRKQQQYNPDLARRLHEAMQYQKEGYFVGVPCSVHHRKLRKLADEIVGDYAYKVQAMAIHHNLPYMPRILNALKGREVYFFTNEYQDLSFFSRMGVELDPERITCVPFRNSYLEYDRYKEMRFPADAVVVLTCGMLAKILTRAWYESHDSLSVLALGSSLDDHIQKKNIQFEVYPKEDPLAVRGKRPFLFGYKKPCRECFQL